jgi:ornithine carbamoyltransferase
MNHFLDIESQSADTIEQLIKTAYQMKKTRYSSQEFAGKTVGLIFEKPSLRTRVSFEVGIKQLGAQCLSLQRDEIGLGKREAVKDVSRVMSRFLDMVMIRTFEHEKLQEFASYSSIPVINGLTDSAHPCQAIADVLTIYENFETLKGLNVVYLGDDNNVSRSLAQVCAKTNMNCMISSPISKPHKSLVATYIKDPFKAVKQADVIYTDTWVSMGDDVSGDHIKKLEAYQVNDELVRCAKKEVIVMHCLPAHRGEEITESVMESKNCVVFDQAENRLHAQKAVMQFLL